MNKVRPSVIWCICSPFFFLNLAVWTWWLFLVPSQAKLEAVLKGKTYSELRLIREHNSLKRQYHALWVETNFLAGENHALNRSFDKMSKVSLQQAIDEAKPDGLVRE